ncbi:hypothetical protein HQ531_03985 [bacterium]|nr:hypothetical protein [bacterium]
MFQVSFQEKSIWISLIVTVLIFGYYQFQVATVFLNPKTDINLTYLFFVAIVLTVTIQIGVQTLLAVVNRKDAIRGPDERDRMIQLKSLRATHYILVVGVWVAGLSIFMEFSAPMIAHAVLFFFILSEIFGFIIQLILYRRGG